MPWFTGPVVAAALLLVVSGAPKLLRPDPAAAALTQLGILRRARLLARLLGAGEVVLGLTVLVSGGPAACAGLAATYAAFTGFVVLALRQPERIRTCGCASADTPPTAAHAVMNALFAGLGAAAALAGGVGPLAQTFSVTEPGTAVTVLGYAVVVAGLGWAVLTLAPRAAR